MECTRLLVNSRTRSRSFFVAFGLGHRCTKNASEGYQDELRQVLMLQAGAISEMLGQSQVGITSDLYTHLFPSKKRDLASRVDKLLGGTS